MKTDILFIDGLLPRSESVSFLGYFLPLATVLEKNSFSFRILNLTMLNDYSLQGLYDVISDNQIKVIGMSTNADNIKYIVRISTFIKGKNSNIRIILGGPEATFNDIRIVQDSGCDFIVRGEGENSLIEIMNALKAESSDFSQISDITYRNEGNEVVRNKTSNNHVEIPINNYSIFKDRKYWIIPTSVSDVQFERFLKIIRNRDAFFSTGRGCPYRCSFCVEGNMKRKINYASLENIRIDLINYLTITGRNDVYIVDDTFTTTSKRVADICNIFREVRHKIDFVWYCEGRVNILAKHPELIDMMYNSGLRKLQIGIESGVQRILDIYNKKITLDEIRKVVAYCTKFEDLILHGNIIIGNPYETDEEFKQTCEFIKELVLLSECRLDITTSFLAPYHGTPIRQNPEEFGFEALDENLDLSSGFGMSTVICKPVSGSITEIAKQKQYFEIELNKTYRAFMFNLTKEEIDKRIEIHNGKYEVNKSFSWMRTYMKLRSFDVILKLKKSKTSVNLSDNLNNTADLYPVKLWNQYYLKDSDGYELSTFKGDEKMIVSDTKAILWNLASGKYSLKKIYESINKKTTMISMEEMIDFFLFLENNYYVVFKKWSL
jgi:radical SAM superfamily enzyme YgiQ (UPF0313 family)